MRVYQTHAYITRVYFGETRARALAMNEDASAPRSPGPWNRTAFSLCRVRTVHRRALVTYGFIKALVGTSINPSAERGPMNSIMRLDCGGRETAVTCRRTMTVQKSSTRSLPKKEYAYIYVREEEVIRACVCVRDLDYLLYTIDFWIGLSWFRFENVTRNIGYFCESIIFAFVAWFSILSVLSVISLE